MPFIPIPNGVRVCVRQRVDGQLVCNVFHVRVLGNPGPPELLEIAGIFKAAWIARVLPLQNVYTTLEAVEARDMSAADAEGIETSVGLPQIGGTSGVALPNNSALATKLITGFTGRSRRGRFFLGGLAATTMDGTNSPNNTLKTALTNFVGDLLTNLAAANYQLAIASLYSSGAPRSSGILTDVISAFVNDTLDSQRRRLPERGA